MMEALDFSPRVRRALIALVSVFVVVHLVIIESRHPPNPTDFELSREFGRRFVAGEPLYAGGLEYTYPPSAAMYFAPLVPFGLGAGFALRTLVAVGCLWLVLRMMQAMVRERSPALVSKEFAVGALTVVLASHYIIRDLDDGGPHLVLLAMLVGGIYCVWKGKGTGGAMLFGLATAIKATPGLFVPFLLWKREWRLASLTAAATLFWIALPMLRMGPTSWFIHERQWAQAATNSSAGISTDAYLSLQTGRNQALRTAVMRYVGPDPHQSSERGDRGPLARVTRRQARWLATLAAFGLLVAFCWSARLPYHGPADPAWPTESSAALVLMLLLSPVTWVQHLVLSIPALYLIVAGAAAMGRLGAPAAAAMAVYVLLALVLNRGVLGKQLYLSLMDYHTHTISMLLILAVVMLNRPAEQPVTDAAAPALPG